MISVTVRNGCLRSGRSMVLASLWGLLMLFSMQSPLSAKEYRFTSLTMESGLSNNSVFTITQDYLGYMWMGTFGGLTRYDGNEYITYKPDPADTNSLTSSVIFDIMEDSQGRVWVGTDGGGLNLYHRDTDSFTSSRFDPDDPSSLSSDQVFSLFEDSSGTIWIGTGGGGLNRMINENQFVAYMADQDSPGALRSDTIRKILQDRSGRLWIGTDGGGLSAYRADEDAFTTYMYERLRPDGSVAVGQSVKALYEDSLGRIWVGFETEGLALFDQTTRLFQPVQLDSDPFTPISVRAIIEDDQGRIWVGTDGLGIFVLTDDTAAVSETGIPGFSVDRILSNPYLEFSLTSNKVRDIFIDTTGLVWIGLRDGGINLFNPLALSFTNISEESPEGRALTKNTIREITESDDGMIWIATDGGGLNRFDPVTGEVSQHLPDTLVSADVSGQTYSLLVDRELLWIGTDGAGLYCYDHTTEQLVSHFTIHDGSGLSSNVIWDIFHDTDGTLWVGTEGGGLNRYDEISASFTAFRFDTYNPTSILGNSVRTVFEDSFGDLWAGTWDGGLNRYISDDQGFARFAFRPGEAGSISDNSINVIFEDSQGSLWIGTAGGGLNLFDREMGVFSAWTKRDGLSSDNVLGILEDDEGFLWLTTDDGLTRFDPMTGSCIKFVQEDGLPSNEFTQKAFYRAKDGRFYLGGTRGVSFFDPSTIQPRSVNSPFLITGLRLQNKNVTVGPLLLEESKEVRSLLDRPLYDDPIIRLAPTDRFITFSFALFDFVNPERNEYSVMLDGLDTRWTDLGNKNSITFAMLPPGIYTLRMRGIHYNGLPHPVEQQVTIHVEKFLWQRWYAILGMIVLGTASLVGIYVLRMRALHAKNAELRQYSLYIQEAREQQGKLIAREIHDELGQTLTSLKFDAFWVRKRLLESPEPLPEVIERSSDMVAAIDTALDSVKTISTRLRPSALDTLSFTEALQWQALEFQNRTGILCRSEGAKACDHIPEEVSITLFRILQEILTNVIRHAQASEVTIAFHESDTEYYLKVSDDGIGCTQKQIRAKDSFGIISMRERCEALGGSVRISSSAIPESMLRLAVTPGGQIENDRTDLVYLKGTTVEIIIPKNR